MKITVKSFVLLAVFSVSIWAQHSFPITKFPSWVVNPDAAINLEFPDIDGTYTGQVTVRFSRTPGGAKVENYNAYSITRSSVSDGIIRRVSFRPTDVPGFQAGVNYLIIHHETANQNSNEVKIIVRHNAEHRNMRIDGRPSGTRANSATPTLSWEREPGVPFSHVLLSDEDVKIGTDASGNLTIDSIKGVSMIWQAITRNNSIAYGEPDPSGVFTSAPPPLSPGKRYTWFVFNNYGNDPAFTATAGMVFPGTFLIPGTARTPPKSEEPKQDATIRHTENDGRITFKWSGLDPNATVYRVFLYAQSPLGDIDAQILAWSGEVMAKEFAGRDTAQLTMTAANVLSSNSYKWRVVAIYGDGSAQAGDMRDFEYSAPSGTLIIEAREEILFRGQRFVQPLAGAMTSLEALSGSREAATAFFTDEAGFAERTRGAGTSRVSIRRDGYESQSRIAQIRENSVETVNFYLRRPFSSIYGRVVDSANTPINLADVIAVSDNGDTVRTQTSADGNFVINCASGDWTVSASRQGFVPSQRRRVSLANMTNSRLEDFELQRTGLPLSGTVRNEAGNPVIGASVRVFNANTGAEVASLLSTLADGRFSFSLESGRYRVVATASGLAPFETGITFSAAQNISIELKSGAAMLKGTLYGVNWIRNSLGALEKTEAGVAGALVEVIDTAGGANTVVATSATDKVYGTYNVTVAIPKGEQAQYKLRFSADGFSAAETFTAAQGGIRDGITVQQDFRINAFASVEGQIFPETGAGLSPQNVSVALVRADNGNQVAMTRSDQNGRFAFFRVPAARYVILANGNGQTKDKVYLVTESGDAQSDTVRIRDARFTADADDGDFVTFVRINTKKADATVIWSARQAAQDTSKVNFTVFSPLSEVLENGTLNNAAAGVSYSVRAVSDDVNIIACAQRRFVFTESELNANREISDLIAMPFRYLGGGGNDTTKATLRVQNLFAGQSVVNINSARVYYRARGETAYEHKTVDGLNTNSDLNSAQTLSFEISPKMDGVEIEYYFEIETLGDGNTTVYSNETYPYTRFIAADNKKISHMELLPAGGTNPITIALNGRFEIFLQAFYGANFKKMDVKAGQITFTSSDPNVLGVEVPTSGDVALARLSGRRAGTAVITVNSNVLDDSDSPIKFPLRCTVTVTNSQIASIRAIMITQPENPAFIKNSEPVHFGVEARDASGNLVSATPQWLVNPSAAGSIDGRTGLFWPHPEFIGRAYIVAQINSRVRHEFSLDDVNKGLLIGYTAVGKGEVSNKRDGRKIELLFGVGAATMQNPVSVTLDNVDIRNSVLRNIEESRRYIISDVAEVRRHSGAEFETPDSVTVKLYVPNIYHRSLRGNESDTTKLKIALWDDENLRWEYLGRADTGAGNTARADEEPSEFAVSSSYDHVQKSLSFPAGGLLNKYGSLRAAIAGRDLNSDALVEISPNPFSPFVSPMNDYIFLTAMSGDVKGTCIKITPKGSSTKYKPSAQVNIYNAEGSMVYTKSLKGLDAGKSYYLFWDGRTQLSRTASVEMEVEPNTALFVAGNELLRNGRYFVTVTLDDGREKQRHTKEIILFK